MRQSQAKINDRGVAALAYNVLLREGVTLGLGLSFDTQKLDQATHKVSSPETDVRLSQWLTQHPQIGTSFTFEG
jgi:hypothetical protein